MNNERENFLRFGFDKLKLVVQNMVSLKLDIKPLDKLLLGQITT